MMGAIPETYPAVGIVLRILSGLLFAAMVVCVKMVSEQAPLGQIIFFRSFFALIPLLVFLWLRREFPSGLHTRCPWGHVLRSSLGAAAMFASFASIARLPVAESTLIIHLAPVLTALAGVLILSERLTIWRMGGAALGLLGIFALVGPELTTSQTDMSRLAGYGYGLLAAVLTAFALIMVRSLNRTENPGTIAFWFVVVSMFGGLLTLPWGWAISSISTLYILIFAGLFGGMAHIAMTLAFRYAEASRLAPFEYIALIWPVLADLLIFRLSLAPSFLLALPLVLGGAALAAMERKNLT